MNTRFFSSWPADLAHEELNQFLQVCKSEEKIDLQSVNDKTCEYEMQVNAANLL